MIRLTAATRHIGLPQQTWSHQFRAMRGVSNRRGSDHRCPAVLLLAAVAFLASSFRLAGAEVIQDAGDSSPLRQTYEKAERLASEDRLEEALAAAEQAAQLVQQEPALEPWHSAVWELLANLCRGQQQFDRAVEAQQQCLQVRETLLGADDWRTVNARLELDKSERLRSMSPELRARWEVARQLERRRQELNRSQQFPEAVEVGRRVLEIDQELFGEKHVETAIAMHQLAVNLKALGQYVQAREHFARAVMICRERLGRLHPETATMIDSLASIDSRQGRLGQALEGYQEALEIRQELPDGDPLDLGQSLNNVAYIHQELQDYERASRFFRRSLEVKREVLGEEHPSTVTGIHNLGFLLTRQGDYAAAYPLLQKSLEITRRTRGPDHLDTAGSMAAMGDLLMQMGDYAAARIYFEADLEIIRRVLGETAPEFAQSLGNLGVLFESMGDEARAIDCFQEAWEASRSQLGDDHPQTALCLMNLGRSLLTSGDLEQARDKLEAALTVFQRPERRRRLHSAFGYSTLSSVSLRQADCERALDEAQRGWELLHEVLGRRHAFTCVALTNVADVEAALGNLERAIELYRQATEDSEEFRNHPQGIGMERGLGELLFVAGKPVEAEQRLRDVLRRSMAHLEAMLDGQSERQQILAVQKLQRGLDSWLTVASATGVPAAEQYAQVLNWKGSVFVRQREIRESLRDPELAELFGELRSVSSRLANLALAVPNPADPNAKLRQEIRGRQIQKLSQRKEDLEHQLAQRSEAFQQVRAARRRTPEAVQASLPRGTALLDFLQYNRVEPALVPRVGVRRALHLMAYVVRPDGEIVGMDLGPVQPIGDAASAWHDAFSGAGAAADFTGPARRLRQLVWAPLEPHLQKMPNILLSPDGPLCVVPFSALPGAAPGSYLLEERRIALLPTPRLLPEVLAPSPEPAGSTATAPSLLLVGDVNYDASPNRSSSPQPEPGAKTSPDILLAMGQRGSDPRGTTPLRFSSLPATAAEIDTIESLWRKSGHGGEIRVVRGSDPSEQTFRRLAPAHHYLHVATHGFELAAETAAEPLSFSEPAGFHLGRMSGLALAGANRKQPSQDAVYGKGPSGEAGDTGVSLPTSTSLEVFDDGILTSLELASLGLEKTDLVVLSACETGLGVVARGEGPIGLQRAFQVAGARSVVASLWSVDDTITRDLMIRFYDNVWNKKLPKLEALRQAQLSILRGEGRSETSELRGPGRIAPAPGTLTPGRVHPRFWAAWVLSGDPGLISSSHESASSHRLTTAAPRNGPMEPDPDRAQRLAVWPWIVPAFVLAAVAALAVMWPKWNGRRP